MADGELEFLRTYEATTLWKPQVVADNVLTGIFLADASHRAALAALLLQEVVEAARRLAAVWGALSDRSQPVARALAAPLPNAEEWERFAGRAGDIEDATEVLSILGVDDSAAESAQELADFAGLSWFTGAIRAFESGPPSVRLEPGQPPVLVAAGFSRAGEPSEVRLRLEDGSVIALGDATGNFVTWAREFLGAYIDAREGLSR